MRTILITSLISLAAATPAAAQQAQTQLAAAVETNGAATAGTEARPAAAAPAAVEKKICKNLPSSYSRRTDRVCLTKDEWAKVEQDSQS
jgi:hypothetical protein